MITCEKQCTTQTLYFPTKTIPAILRFVCEVKLCDTSMTDKHSDPVTCAHAAKYSADVLFAYTFPILKIRSVYALTFRFVVFPSWIDFGRC